MGDVNTVVVAIAFAFYSLLIIAVGVYSAKFSTKTDEDFFLANRSLGSWVAALSASASSESGWVTLGLVGWAFTEGAKAYWIIPGCTLGFLFNWFVIAGKLNDRSKELRAVTLPDFFSKHFSEKIPWIRALSVFVILVAMLLYVAAQFAAAGKAFSATFTSIDYAIGVLIGACIVLLYTVLGGFRAVCWTDFLQGLLMLGTLVLFPIYLILSQGGVSPTSETLLQADPNFLRLTPDVAPLAFMGFLFGSGALGINFGYPGQPHVLARFMSLRDRRAAIGGGIISIVWAVMVYWGAVTIGLFARAMALRGEEWAQVMLEKPDIYGELGLVLSAMNLMPGILSGLVLAAVLAAICSTADSQLAVAGSMVSGDLYTGILKKRKSDENMNANRWAILFLGVLAIFLVIDEEIRVYKYVLTYGWAILGASFGPQLILVLFWKQASRVGCLLGMLVGFLVAVIWPNVYDASITGVEVYNLPLAFVLAALVNIAFSKIFPDART